MRRLNNLVEEEIRVREEVLLNNLELRKLNDELRFSIDLLKKKARPSDISQIKRAWSPEKEDDLLEC